MLRIRRALPCLCLTAYGTKALLGARLCAFGAYGSGCGNPNIFAVLKNQAVLDELFSLLTRATPYRAHYDSGAGYEKP